MNTFPLVEQLQELLKSYYACLRYDPSGAASILQIINEIRLRIGLDAEVLNIWWEQVNVVANATGFQDTAWFSRNDINYLIRRGVCNLNNNVNLSAVDEGNKQRLVTREPLAWQQLFSQVQNSATAIAQVGQQLPFDLPQELAFQKNETLGLSVQNQADDARIIYHGADLKETIEQVRVDEIKAEIAAYLPEPQLVPITFQFTTTDVGNHAVNPSGGNDIFSTKNDRSVILTHVSMSSPNCKFTLTDEGRSQLICEEVESTGMAGFYKDPFSTYYPLPYAHLLRKGDRLRLRGLNGSDITTATEAANTLFYLVFKGYSL